MNYNIIKDELIQNYCKSGYILNLFLIIKIEFL